MNTSHLILLFAFTRSRLNECKNKVSSSSAELNLNNTHEDMKNDAVIEYMKDCMQYGKQTVQYTIVRADTDSMNTHSLLFSKAGTLGSN